MIVTDEDALICDFAETYHIYDYKQLPARKAAVFASGLRDDSRVKMKMAGMNADPKTTLLAAVADRVGTLAWMQSKDGAKGRNRPASILAKIIEERKKEDDIAAFENGEAYERERSRILRGET